MIALMPYIQQLNGACPNGTGGRRKFDEVCAAAGIKKNLPLPYARA